MVNVFKLISKVSHKPFMQISKRYHWYKIAQNEDELDFGVNNLLQLEVGEKSICIARQKDELTACSGKCPHASGLLADGYIDPLGNIVCPVHRYRFSLQNGRNVSGEGYHLKTYPVEIREDGVYVGIGEGGLLSKLFHSTDEQ